MPSSKPTAPDTLEIPLEAIDSGFGQGEPSRPVESAQDTRRPGPALTLQRALTMQINPEPDLGRALRAMGGKPQHIELALQQRKLRREPLSMVMRDLGLLSVEKVAKALALHKGYAYFAPEMIDEVNREALLEAGIDGSATPDVIPVALRENTLFVAIADERQEQTAKNSFFREKRQIRFLIASQETIQTAYRRLFAKTVEEFDKALAGNPEDPAYHNKLLEALLRHACFVGVSDIHMAPSSQSGLILLRVDGVRQNFRVLSKETLDRLIRILATDGRVNDMSTMAEASIETPPEDLKDRYGFRVELGNSVNGQTAVIRILDRHGTTADFDSLGFDQETTATLLRYIQTSAGLVFVTGPTGSGKTTSLYSLLKMIDPLERSVQTIENPAEYRSGLWYQYEIKRGTKTDEGREWSEWFRGILRNDPDVVLLGEVRDKGTAQTVVDAANTGHLVFTTLHTNTAIKTVSRLREMGLDMDALANVLLGVLAQRLVRRLCPMCKVQDNALNTREELKSLNNPQGRPHTPFKAGKGCPHCRHTGYRGRRMIYEVLDVNDTIRRLIASNDASHRLLEYLPASKRMWNHGLLLVSYGETSVDELKRVAVKE